MVQRIFVILVFVFLLAPIIVLLVSAINSSEYFVFPPEGLSLRWLASAVHSSEYRASLGVSLYVAISATCISVALGTLTAFALNRYSFRGKTFVDVLVVSPLLLPTIVWSIALIQFYAILRMTGTFLGLVLAHSVIGVPYTVRVVLANLNELNPDIENAAMTLGASPRRTFFMITLPLLLPGVLVGAVFSFLISFNDVIVSSFVAGARYITFPVRVYSELRTEGLDPTAVATSVIIILLIVTLAIAGEYKANWSKYI